MLSLRQFYASARPRPMIVAHRGAWHHASENSVPAIEAAIHLGVEMVEIDLRRSTDGQLFLMHDVSLERMCGVDIEGESLTLAQLQELPLKAGKGGPEAPEVGEIATLDQALACAKGRIYLDLDVKDPRDLITAAHAVTAKGMQHQVDLKLPVNTPAEAQALARLEAQTGIMVMPMSHFTTASIEAQILRLKALGACVTEAKFDDPELLADYRADFEAAGISVWVNTLDWVAPPTQSDSAALANPDAVWGALTRAGGSVIQTDEPEALLRSRGPLMESLRCA